MRKRSCDLLVWHQLQHAASFLCCGSAAKRWSPVDAVVDGGCFATVAVAAAATAAVATVAAAAVIVAVAAAATVVAAAVAAATVVVAVVATVAAVAAVVAECVGAQPELRLSLGDAVVKQPAAPRPAVCAPPADDAAPPGASAARPAAAVVSGRLLVSLGPLIARTNNTTHILSLAATEIGKQS